MHTYDTFEELVVLLDKHFKNTDRFHFSYHIKDPFFHYVITIDSQKALEGDVTIDDTSIPSYKLPEDAQDWFWDQWYHFHRNDIPSPSETGDDITLSDHVIVTDPCYDSDTWCNGQLTNVKPGTYHTKATYTQMNGWGRRCTSLIVWHESITEPTDYEHTDITVGVDSGQAGIIDFPYFKELEADGYKKEKWYDNIQTFTHIRKPIKKHLLPIIDKAKELYTHAQTILSARFKAKEKGNLPLADLLMDDWFKIDRKLQKLLRDNSLDIQSLDDHTTAPRFAYKLWTDKHSAITGTGLGDGSYDCFIAKNGDQIVGIKIDYFYDEDED